MATHKYLRDWAEPDIELARVIRGRYRHVVVIPACNESPEFIRRLHCSEETLMIVVVNQAPDAARDVRITNRRLFEYAEKRFNLIERLPDAGSSAMFRLHGRPLDVLLLDRFSAGREIPRKGGVGQARKIGADLALALIESGVVETQWILNSDADAAWPEDYVMRCEAAPSGVALYPFTHLGRRGERVTLLTEIYELSLANYVDGLKRAGSPYAFQTIGSTIAVTGQAYAQVRGFPKREAAEDFYILNKLAKVDAVSELDGEPIRLECRFSDRVPFGTGAAVAKLAESDDPRRLPIFYADAVFVCLALWLELLPHLWQSRSWVSTVRAYLDNAVAPIAPDDFLDCLTAMNVGAGLTHAQDQARSLAQFEKHMHDWFDAFRTLKMVHWLRDHHFPSRGVDAVYPGVF